MQPLWNTIQANIVGEQQFNKCLEIGVLRTLGTASSWDHLLKTGLNSFRNSMHISSYYDCNFCAVCMHFICSVFYEIIKCYMQTTILHIHSTEVKPKAKWNQCQKKQQKTKKQKPRVKWSQSQKPNGHANWLQTAANSTQIRDFGSKMQQIQARSQKPKEPEAKSLFKVPRFPRNNDMERT